jgi:hypothetical protein
MGVNTRTLTSKRARILGGGIQRMALDRPTTAGGATPAAQRAERVEGQIPNVVVFGKDHAPAKG